MKYLNKFDCKNCVGEVYKTNNSGDIEVLSYTNSKNVEIKFLKSGNVTTVYSSNIVNGTIKDVYSPTLYGVGIVGSKYVTRFNSKSLPQYEHWKGMIRRCYNDKERGKFETYNDCTVSENFLHYEYFYEWCNKQIGFNCDNFDLDKDLLVKGNRVYSEHTSIFLPREINSALTKNGKTRGEHLIGVSWHKATNKFIARVDVGLKNQKHLGLFNTEIEAFNTYKIAKESYLKHLAEKWKDKIDPRAYNALMNYQVDITD